MRIRVLVVVAARQLTPSPVVARPQCSPAVRTSNAAPSLEGVHNLAKLRSLREDTAALAHRYVMRGIEAHRCCIAEFPNWMSANFRSESVTTIFDDPKVMLSRALKHSRYVEGLPRV